MEGKPQQAPLHPRVRLYVFSLTVDWPRLREILQSDEGSDATCVVTPHYLFPSERERLQPLRNGVWFFKTFHDLLDLADMEHCDAEADRQVLRREPAREGRVSEYYTTIKELKNRCAMRRLQAELGIAGGAVLSRDLGIDARVWLELGLTDGSVDVPRRRLSLRAKIQRAFTEPMPCHILTWNSRRWLFLGRPERLVQYLDLGKVTLRPLGKSIRIWFNVQVLVAARLAGSPRTVGIAMRILNLPCRVFLGPLEQAASTVHEDNPAVAWLANSLGLDYVNLQDSFLPGYYPSRYLLYRPRVQRFYVWDELSRGIFSRHGLTSSRWPVYRSWELPRVARTAGEPVRRIVYLASGAGDWTALKNRSDEDLALSLLADVARSRPDVSIRYRPHPLWLHPEHQGLNSIERVIECSRAMGLPNLMVSQGARKDGQRFSLTGNLSSVSSSVEEDIDWADLVLGEHSQTILVAAQRGKIVAGINVAKHPAYFGDYAELGFPLVTSAEQLLQLIDRIGEPAVGADFLCEYNRAIARHNRENCRTENAIP